MITACCVIFFFGWHVRANNEVTLPAVLFFSVLCVVCHLAGTLILRFVPVESLSYSNYPFAFLLGYLFVGSSLFLLVLASSSGVKFDFAVVVAAIVVWATVTRVAEPAPLSEGSVKHGSIAVVISLAAATLWAQDALRPVTFAVSETARHWPDSFIHARYISSFANQSPANPIQYISAAGETSPLYHYAIYTVPAALSAFTATPAYTVLGSFMMPAGIFMTGLAAYAIGSAFWGKPGGVAATVALLLLPDAAQQGVHNHWYSYHFLQQVTPGGLFGVAIVGASWVYMFDACRTGRVVSLGASYLLAAVSVTYKAQFFVANAFLLWLFPALFFGSLSVRKRLAWAFFAFTSYWLLLKLAERVPALPTISLDGRGLLRSSKWIVQNFDSDAVQGFLAQFLPQASDSRLYSVMWIAAMTPVLLVITFGVFVPLYVGLAWRLRRATSRMVLLFPLFVVVVYLVMSIGMSPNVAGNPDELIHRPFVWAYFVVSAWVGGAAWIALSDWLSPRSLRRFALGTVPILFVVPWVYGKGIEIGPTRLWNNFHDWWHVPAGLAQAAHYIRENSGTADIVQDSQGDGKLILSGLSERQPYVQQWDFSVTEGRPQPKIINDRFAEITRFKNLTRREDIVGFAQRNRIKWVVVHPDDALAWPDSVTSNPSFESGGYRVYRFGS